MQTQTVGGDAAPESSNGRAPSSGDAFVDSALEAFESLGGDVTPGKRKAPVKEPAAEPAAPGTEEGDEHEEESLAGEPDEDEREGAAEGDDEESDAHDRRGSKEEPFSVKDLPADKFIELKVDGEKKVVSLAELASGYIGQATISQRLNRTKQMADEAQAAIKKATETREQVRSAMREFLSDPEQLYAYFNETGEREQVLTAVAMKLADQVRRFRQNPEERLKFERARDEARLRWEREQWEAAKQAELQQKQQAEMNERAIRIFRPGWEAGIKRAGFPQPTKELYEEVMVRCNQRAASGAEVTSDDVAEFTYRACKLLELKPKGANKPRPAPPPTPKEPRRANGKDPWKDMPSDRRRKDPDYFLKSLRSRDYRL
jgi:hypothetical protein